MAVIVAMTDVSRGDRTEKLLIVNMVINFEFSVSSSLNLIAIAGCLLLLER